MKRMILWGWMLLSMVGVAEAQQSPKKASARKTANTEQKQTVKKSRPVKTDTAQNKKAYALTQTGNYKAFSSGVISNRYFIADSTIRILNLRAANNDAGAGLNIRDVTGAGKGAYGIFKGRLTLIPYGSRSTGGITGSGAVGTGTSPGVVGAAGPAMGVNGKNPYAGPSVYGTVRPGIGTSDSSSTRTNQQ